MAQMKDLGEKRIWSLVLGFRRQTVNRKANFSGGPLLVRSLTATDPLIARSELFMNQQHPAGPRFDSWLPLPCFYPAQPLLRIVCVPVRCQTPGFRGLCGLCPPHT